MTLQYSLFFINLGQKGNVSYMKDELKEIGEALGRGEEAEIGRNGEVTIKKGHEGHDNSAGHGHSGHEGHNGDDNRNHVKPGRSHGLIRG